MPVTGDEPFRADTSPLETRRRAEERLLSADEAGQGGGDANALLHELRVHQIELEIQNEELRRIQLALEETRDRYIDLYEFAPVGYLTLSANGVIAEINLTGATLLGGDRAKLLGRPFASFVAAEDGDLWHRHLRHALNTPGPQDCDLRLSKGDGVAFQAHLDSQLQERGAEPMLRVALSDVTARREAEMGLAAAREALLRTNASLTASNRDLEQFAYAASHDLQEPLRMIVSYGQLLEKKYSGGLDDDARAFIGFMVEGGKRMQAMVTDLLEFSRVDRLGGDQETFGSGDAVAKALFSLSFALTEVEAQVTSDGLPAITYDRAQFTRLLQNLIGNALKYRDPHRPPAIAVAARRDDGQWVFSVSDNGIGIHPDYHQQIFGMFRRLHTRDKYDGTGVGLAICKKIVERHGGSIWVESEPGAGSAFCFTVLDGTAQPG